MTREVVGSRITLLADVAHQSAQCRQVLPVRLAGGQGDRGAFVIGARCVRHVVPRPWTLDDSDGGCDDVAAEMLSEGARRDATLCCPGL